MNLKISEDVSQWNTMGKLIEWMNGEDTNFYPLVVDIGANDGKRLSNSWNLITENQWKGILVEPVETSFHKIWESYKDKEYVPLRLCCAVSDTNQEKVIWVGGEDNMLSSLETVAGGGPAMICQCITPRELFDKYDVKDVGVLSVDTEGHDFTILSSMMLETKVRPQIIITETWPHLYYDNIQKHSLLFNEGYMKVLHCGENEIFYRS